MTTSMSEAPTLTAIVVDDQDFALLREALRVVLLTSTNVALDLRVDRLIEHLDTCHQLRTPCKNSAI